MRNELRELRERVKFFQDRTEDFKRKRRGRKRPLNQVRQLPPKTEDESLLVIDPNAPDALHPDADGPDFGWLDEACEVKGDRLDVTDEEDSEAEERESNDELYLSSSRKDKGKQKAQWRDVDMENVGDRDRPLPRREAPRAIPFRLEYWGRTNCGPGNWRTEEAHARR
ncbi:hypothetical protein HYDPIDRAFT_39451 [Hydnomerulius pinastri MD-312]|nr:hypothetical protein HYDPIDRAFT_39451 [Hydnomerulius pinastri MD-312]